MTPHDSPAATALTTPAQFYHVCFAVPDIAAAMAELTELVGAQFGAVRDESLGGWEYTIVFTTTAPHIELVSGSPGSPWETTTPRFHHLGWWSDCLDETVEAWTGPADSAHDASVATTGPIATMMFDGRAFGRRFAYVDGPRSGVRFEAVDRSGFAGFLERITPETG